jgi:hypothetical protein
LRLQKGYQQPVGIAGHTPDYVTAEIPVLADTFGSAQKRLHFQPVGRLFQRICPGGSKAAVALPRLIASRPAGAGGACRGADIAGLAKRNKKGRLPALRRSACTGWLAGAVIGGLSVKWLALRYETQRIIGIILFCAECQD